ncbi:hypothetical protein LMG28614_00525 [Paraburkholderia ultramafica]|uniref:Uncharacterized protein n=1 Tax=Paraburkholderia ultramafica TaxID=1544867 RepID=A0A6S7AUU9_9BURK|nr:hypothetical protein LMG28614_00525 [Paraburkholderia ultramafica]
MKKARRCRAFFIPRPIARPAVVLTGRPDPRPWNAIRNTQYKPAASAIDTGSVSTHARIRLRTVPHCRPEPLAAIVPATPDDSTCVVETGKPYMSAAPIVTIATISADAPCPYVRCCLPIFSPTVTTMRFHPTIVPRPSAMATATLTHVGMNLVA